MGRYTNFSSIKNVTLTDIDGDGRTDIVFLIRYDTFAPDWKNTLRITDYLIYYQRNGYFERDWEFSGAYISSENDTISDIAERASEFWRRK